jgi:hypothetical protein
VVFSKLVSVSVLACYPTADKEQNIAAAALILKRETHFFSLENSRCFEGHVLPTSTDDLVIDLGDSGTTKQFFFVLNKPLSLKSLTILGSAHRRVSVIVSAPLVVAGTITVPIDGIFLMR